jgi:hypothetical protein
MRNYVAEQRFAPDEQGRTGPTETILKIRFFSRRQPQFRIPKHASVQGVSRKQIRMTKIQMTKTLRTSLEH